MFKNKIILEDNVYVKKLSDETVKKVSEFYKDKPFPNYKNNDNKATLLSSGNNNYLANIFKKKIGFNKKKILEVGCGTGQLSIYFSIGVNNLIYALDSTRESIELGKNFAKKNKINNIFFLNLDLFDDEIHEKTFDYIWCNGMLHHTKDPELGFSIISKILKKDGYLLVGLYNKIGRIRTYIRIILFKIFGKKILTILDPVLRKLKKDEQVDAWIQDQYIHPVEKSHTYDEVLNWFDKNNIEFISAIPKIDYLFRSQNYDKLFTKQNRGTFIERILVQILMIFGNFGADGGLFIMIGKKK
jgi:2-polyprenyl-3-methyl-5-hydroxy-6-metoxy-1,4-benzoquinol methylase